MGVIHFAYVKPGITVTSRNRLLRALEFRARKALDYLAAPSYKLGPFPANGAPLPAPYSITRNLYGYLSKRNPTYFYDYRAKRGIRPAPHDVVLGHPCEEPDTLIQRLFQDSTACRCRALIFPLHHALAHINEYALPLMPKADVVFGIMGPYWFDSLPRSPFAPWQEKIVRLDMAIDSTHYPLLKQQFNPPGRRGLLYIGNNRPEKGTGILSKTFTALKEFRTGWVGGGPEIDGIPRIANYRPLTQEFVQGLAADFDIFVNTSVSDANPTTILEAMAWGFPVACTPESGYYRMPTIIELSTTDIPGNVEKLRQLQFAPVERLVELSRRNRRLVETEYTWDRFCGTVWRKLEGYLS